MQWILKVFGQKPRLQDWENRAASLKVEQGPRPKDNCDCFEREVAKEALGAPEQGGPHQRVAKSIMAYEIFPPEVVSPVLHRSPIQVGDTVGILFHFLPGVDLFCGAIVLECFDEERDEIWRTGFKYRTLSGHPELGEETFSVEKNMNTGTVIVALRSWSRAGTWLTWLGWPYTRYSQIRANKSALAYLAMVASQKVSLSKSN